jgi:hypothetical protein
LKGKLKGQILPVTGFSDCWKGTSYPSRTPYHNYVYVKKQSPSGQWSICYFINSVSFCVEDKKDLPSNKNVPPMYAVERGIKIPEKKNGRVSFLHLKYPFDSMIVGNSFFVPATSSVKKGNLMSDILAVCRKLKSEKKLPGTYTITTRTLVGGIRCWRIK